MRLGKPIRIVAGLIFTSAGLGKLLILPLIAHYRPGTPTFGDVLAAVHVPMPALTALGVCALEIAGGLALLVGRYVRLAGVALAGDMLGALASLSVPATFFGRPAHVGGFTLGNEIWRVPLEASLLGAVIWLASSRERRLRDAG
jgi:putative oxidoreductase